MINDTEALRLACKHACDSLGYEQVKAIHSIGFREAVFVLVQTPALTFGVVIDRATGTVETDDVEEYQYWAAKRAFDAGKPYRLKTYT